MSTILVPTVPVTSTVPATVRVTSTVPVTANSKSQNILDLAQKKTKLALNVLKNRALMVNSQINQKIGWNNILVFLFSLFFISILLCSILLLFFGRSRSNQEKVNPSLLTFNYPVSIDIKINPISNTNSQTIQTFDRPEVFNIKHHQHCLSDANKACLQYGARLASKKELEDAYKNGANWCNLGWISEKEAYYPIQKEQAIQSDQWPEPFRQSFKKIGLNGGNYEPQLKLSATCYGIKPLDPVNINPWNTITQKWSKYSEIQ
jgi:hypothetical protein